MTPSSCQPPFPLWCPYIFFSSLVSLFLRSCHSLFDLAVKGVSSPPLALVMMEGVCTAAKWTCNVISCFFPISAYWQLTWEFWISPHPLACRWRSYVPSKCTLDPGDRVGSCQGEGGRFAHSLHTAARLPGQLCHLSEAEPPSRLPSPSVSR